MKNPIRALVYPLLVSAALTRHASADLLVNGNFTQISDSTGKGFTYGEFGTAASSVKLTETGWTSTAYTFVYAPNTADQGTSTGANTGVNPEAPGQYANTSAGYGTTYLWGPNNGGATAASTNPYLSLSTPPFAGNFVAGDAAFSSGPISQTVQGLRTGQAYTLTFFWAVAQQQNFTGENDNNYWSVTLPGSSTAQPLVVTTPGTNLASHAFSGWTQSSYSFTYNGGSTTLSFTAVQSLTGNQVGGQPPFMLLGNVTLVPEPSSGTLLSLVGAGLTAGWFVRRRRRLAVADAQA